MSSSPLPGEMLGHYLIREKLGAGGMGDVYRASDQRLGREVAIKLLPEAFARDRDRLMRFEREARLLAALNHPNVASVYGFEPFGDRHALVMELVPGETLAERIARGRHSIQEILDLFRQMAAGLEAAHEKGIVHRDLKPANIMVTPTGQVKVLDFGIALALESAESGSALSKAPTLQEATKSGVILGTPSYLSPEQARGRPVDRRTDLWALGCILFEALTGRKTFGGETVSDTLAAILDREPDWSALPEGTPLAVRSLLRRCLQKDPERRQRDAGDARLLIEEAIAGPSEAPGAARASARWPAYIVAAAVASAVTGAILWNWKPLPARPPSARLVLPLAPGELLVNENSVPAFSPDGVHLAYVAARDGASPQIYLRRLDEHAGVPLRGTEGGFRPFFSPDGQWIGFFTERKLMKVATSGGSPQILWDRGVNFRGGSWGADGRIVFAPSPSSGLRVVPADGGESRILTTLEPGETRHYWPEILPGGKAVLFTVGTASGEWDDAQIAALSLVTGKRHLVVRGGTYVRYVPTGHIVFSRAGTLFAAPFDPERLEMKGVPAPVLESVLQTNTGAAQFAFSKFGSLVYLPGDLRGFDRSLVWVDRTGVVQPLAVPPRSYNHPRLSPDGRRLAVHVDTTSIDLWLYDLTRDVLSRLTFEFGNFNAVWTPDGRRIAFSSTRESGAFNLYWMSADGSGSVERLTTSDNLQIPADFSSDGRLLAFVESRPDTGTDIWWLPLEGERVCRPFLATPFNEEGPRFSPDGRWLAYASDEGGRSEVYVRRFPGPGSKTAVSTAGGREPVWSKDGREIFYRQGDTLMAVAVGGSEDLTLGKPKPLFNRPWTALTHGRPNYDVTRDGQRFVVIQNNDPELKATELHVVTDWFRELETRLKSERR